jgi:hypothetical protein
MPGTFLRLLLWQFVKFELNQKLAGDVAESYLFFFS